MDLKPCPFCGGKAQWDNWFKAGIGCFVIECRECLARTGVGVCKEKELTIEAWNKRTTKSVSIGR